MASNEKIAVLGAGGTMGFAMARNLARAGFEVRAWNRSREKAEPLRGDGAHVPETPAQAADGATVILTAPSGASISRASMGSSSSTLPFLGRRSRLSRAILS